MFEPPQHVIDAYKEPHRKYHNLDHIQSILDKIPLFTEAYSLSEEDIIKLKVIAWYHDAVYVPGAKDNESKSADLLLDDEEIDTDMLTKAIAYGVILDTVSHSNPIHFTSAIFFDLDLADMGTDTYVENSFKIREEFGEFSDLEWLAGRQKFLGDFLARPFIFHTSLGYKLWEEKARRNMENELHFLKGKYGF